MEKIIDIDKLKNDLQLTDHQIKLLSDAIEKIISKYEELEIKATSQKGTYYFGGCVNGLNICHKIINGENDDYNSIK